MFEHTKKIRSYKICPGIKILIIRIVEFRVRKGKGRTKIFAAR